MPFFDIPPPREQRPEDYCTRAITVDANPDADCPLWKQFLLRVMGDDQTMVDYLQRVCGYCLTGLTTEHVLFFAHGSGANGKSTFSGVLLGILGVGPFGYAAVAPISTFTASNHEQHTTDLAMLQGVRCVIAQETEEGRSWATAKLKMMTGGDPISARLMRHDFFTYMPQFKIIILGNHKPALHNVDEAIRRRFHLIPFTVTIPEAERDPKLPEKLKDEYPAILAWMDRRLPQVAASRTPATSQGAGCNQSVPRQRRQHQCLDHRVLPDWSGLLCHAHRAVRLLEDLGTGQR